MTPPFKRSLYSKGSPLSASQLTDDQNFNVGWRDFLNGKFNGWGIFEGLTVNLSDNGLKVTAGTATSKSGTPIIISSPFEKSFDTLDAKVNEFLVVASTPSTPRYVDSVESPKGANFDPLWTSCEYLSEISIMALEVGMDARQTSNELAEAGYVTLGHLKKIKSDWEDLTDIRHQGPIDPAGGPNAFLIEQGLGFLGFAQGLNTARLNHQLRIINDRLFWVVIALLSLLLPALFAVWLAYPQLEKPYRLIIDPDKNILGPIAGTTYDQGEYSVTILDRHGKGLKDVEVTFELTKKSCATFLTSQQAQKAKSSVLEYAPDRIVVRTDKNGKASPTGIRFSELPTPLSAAPQSCDDCRGYEDVVTQMTIKAADLTSFSQNLFVASNTPQNIEVLGKFPGNFVSGSPLEDHYLDAPVSIVAQIQDQSKHRISKPTKGYEICTLEKLNTSTNVWDDWSTQRADWSDISDKSTFKNGMMFIDLKIKKEGVYRIQIKFGNAVSHYHEFRVNAR